MIHFAWQVFQFGVSQATFIIGTIWFFSNHAVSHFIYETHSSYSGSPCHLRIYIQHLSRCSWCHPCPVANLSGLASSPRHPVTQQAKNYAAQCREKAHREADSGLCLHGDHTVSWQVWWPIMGEGPFENIPKQIVWFYGFETKTPLMNSEPTGP